jgi:hypothetical protein
MDVQKVTVLVQQDAKVLYVLECSTGIQCWYIIVLSSLLYFTAYATVRCSVPFQVQ